MTTSFVYGTVAPASTTWLSTCAPSIVTTMVSGSSEQFLTVPEIVILSPGQADVGLGDAVSSTHGLSLQRTSTVVFLVSEPQSLEPTASIANDEFCPAVQFSGIVVLRLHLMVWPAPTVLL